jgi:hypothetical protein
MIRSHSPSSYLGAERKLKMAATTAGTKTVSKDLGPGYTASQLTAILAIPIESLTIAQFRFLEEALRKVSRGHDPSLVIGTLLN